METNVQSPAGRASPRAASHVGGPDDSRPAAAPGPDIAALTRRMADGDETAWRMFYNAYLNRLWRYLLVVAAGNEDAAREALQGALVRAARHMKMFRDETVFWSWLTVLARSAFADEAKKRRRYLSFLDRFTRHAAAEPVGGGLADERLETMLERRIALLPPDERQLIEEKYFARRAIRDLAAEWHTTEKAVESKLSRIRRKLKEAVLAELNDESQR